MKKTIIILGIIFFIVGLFCGIATGISRKNRETNPIRINYQKSSFQDFNVENDVVNIKCKLYIYNVYDEDKSFYIKAKSSEDVGTLLSDENLTIKENGKEKVFELKANESADIDVIFEGKYGGTNQKADRQLPDDIEIVYIDEKVGGNMKIQNYIENSFEKMNLLDITVTEQEKQSTINNILQMPSDMLNDMEKNQILGLVLDNIGRAEYNIENNEYKLFSNNVYSFDTEVIDIDMMYTIFLNFVNKLSNNELEITDIIEDNNNINYEQGTGEKIVSFKLNGKEYKYIAKVQNDWFDMEMIGYINKILQENNSKKFLYVSSDGWQNCILFYNTEEWAEKFNSNFTEINIEKIDLK